MRFPPQFLDELRARLPVSEVVGRRVKLRKTGREFVGLSPFNKEKSPSFTVNDQKGFYHDFSSGKHGDIFGFIMETEGVAFPEAVERLAQMAGVPMPKFSKEEEARDEKRKTLHEVMELAAKFFEATLGRARRRQGARLSRRPRARFGDAVEIPPGLRAGRALCAEGASRRRRASASRTWSRPGLLIAGDDIPVPYDRFRDRVMFPITDFRGRIIAFGGRALAPDAPAKYLNSPETPLFHKGSNLYNGAAARQAVHDGAALIVVEGYVDVIAMVHRRLSGGGRAARHRAHRGSARPALEDGRRADPLLRRRQGRPARRLSRGRHGDAAAAARQEPALCDAARRPGPRRPLSLRRARGDRRGAGAARARSARCCGAARPKRPRSTRRSGAPRSRRACTRWCAASAMNRCANITPRISRRGCGS